MPKIHLLLKKEEIDEEKITNHKIVVIFDILLATSTIAAALEYGAKRVIPVLNGTEAHEMAAKMQGEDYLLVGEYQGKTIDGFLSPNPKELRGKITGKTVILSTTNGTVAIKKSVGAKRVYAASVLNSLAVVEHLLKHHQNETIVLVCSGSADQFNMEDFYGAGYFIDCLMNGCDDELELTDSAHTSYLFYQNNRNEGLTVLRKSRVGKRLVRYGFESEIEYISQQSCYSVVPLLVDNNQLINAQKERV